jgi:hypothetical protein
MLTYIPQAVFPFWGWFSGVDLTCFLKYFQFGALFPGGVLENR